MLPAAPREKGLGLGQGQEPINSSLCFPLSFRVIEGSGAEGKSFNLLIVLSTTVRGRGGACLPHAWR